jgi:hypothetical protein
MNYDQKKRNGALFGLVLIIALLFAATSVHAQFVNAPAVVDSLNQKLGSIFKIYEIQGFTTDEKGRQVPIFNSQYEGVRIAIDFFILFLIFGLRFKKSKPIQDSIGAGGSLVLALVLSVAFIAGSRMLVGRLVPLWPYILILAAAMLLYAGLLGMFGGEEGAGSGTKMILVIASIAIAGILYLLLFTAGTGEGFFGKFQLPFQKKATEAPGTGTAIQPPRIISPGDADTKANTLYAEAEAHYTRAQQLFNEGKYAEAQTEINQAEVKNREGAPLAP